jgi:hypothetical protein
VISVSVIRIGSLRSGSPEREGGRGADYRGAYGFAVKHRSSSRFAFMH